METLKKKFFELHVLDGMKYDEVSKILEVDRKQFTSWYEDLRPQREAADKARRLFNNKLKNGDFKYFKDKGFRFFYEWYKNQPRRCYYCGVNEDTLSQLFTKGILRSERRRGKSLELERLNAKSNQYTPKNCVFACYFCNNHKSDIITAKDQKKYFAKSIRQYLEDKLKKG